MDKFTGVLTALATPFKDNQIDTLSLKKLIRHQMDGQVHGLVIMGTTGENPTLSHKEQKHIFDIVKSEISGQVPVVMGVGSNSTSQTIEKSQQAINWGADALLCVVPYYNKPPQRGLFHHFHQISQCAGQTPVLLYNVPSRTITSLSLQTILSLSQCENIIGIKEASGNMNFDRALIHALDQEADKRSNKDFYVVSGDDNSFDFFMEIGGDGIISVISNLLPSKTVDIYNAYMKGDVKEGRSQFQALKKYIDALDFDANPIPIKAALYLSKIISTPEVRSPLLPPEGQKLQELEEQLEKLS